MELKEKIGFLKDIVMLQLNAISNYYQKSNVILVISGLILSLTLSSLLKEFPTNIFLKIGVIIMILSSLGTVALILIFIKPQMLEGKKKGLFYRDFLNPPKMDDYLKKLDDIFKSESRIIEAYVAEIQNLGEILRPLVKIVGISVTLLLISLITGFAVLAISFL